MVGVFRSVVRKEGFPALYVGVANPLIALTILNTLNFSQYATFRSVYQVRDSVISQGGFEWRTFLAGASVGPISSIVSTPFELVKTQMVLHSKELGVSGSSSLLAAMKISKSYGVSALYRGHIVNSLREVVFIGSYFTFYEHTKEMWTRLTKKAGLPSETAIPLAGGMSGAASWFLSFPLDCIKSNIQGCSLKESALGTIATGKKVLKERGVRGLYQGASPSIARAFIVSSSRFTIYEGTLELCRRYFP
jgi:solute carrier family 25 carnitine/acylcarnitine transporter 20/29